MSFMFRTTLLLSLTGALWSPLASADGLGPVKDMKLGTAAQRAALFLSAAELQSGGWAWDLDAHKASPNYGGIVAESLLSAYEQTGEQSFLDSALAYAELLQKRFAKDPNARPFRPDIEFLVRMTEVSGEPRYAKTAAAWFAVLKRQAPSGDDELQRLLLGRAEISNLVGFDAALDIRAALAVGDLAYAQSLADAALARQSQWLGAASTPYAILAQAALADALQMLDPKRYAAAAEKFRALLIKSQDANGAWSTNATQTTAYAIRALAQSKDARAQSAAKRSAAWLQKRLLQRGAWASYHDGLPEPFHGQVISEVHAEALNAMILAAQL